jgi:hypothetical protein
MANPLNKRYFRGEIRVDDKNGVKLGVDGPALVTFRESVLVTNDLSYATNATIKSLPII